MIDADDGTLVKQDPAEANGIPDWVAVALDQVDVYAVEELRRRARQ